MEETPSRAPLLDDKDKEEIQSASIWIPETPQSDTTDAATARPSFNFFRMRERKPDIELTQQLLVKEARQKHINNLTKIALRDTQNFFAKSMVYNHEIVSALRKFIRDTGIQWLCEIIVRAAKSNEREAGEVLSAILHSSTTTKEDKLYALQKLIMSGDFNAVEKLIQLDKTLLISTDYLGRTPIMWAVLSDNSNRFEVLNKITSLLTDAQKKLVDAVDIQGRTALMLAINTYDLCNRVLSNYILKLLLEKGANIDIADKEGITAPMLAAWCGYEEVYKVLSKYKFKRTKIKLDYNRDIQKALNKGKVDWNELTYDPIPIDDTLDPCGVRSRYPINKKDSIKSKQSQLSEEHNYYSRQPSSDSRRQQTRMLVQDPSRQMYLATGQNRPGLYTASYHRMPLPDSNRPELTKSTMPPKNYQTSEESKFISDSNSRKIPTPSAMPEPYKSLVKRSLSEMAEDQGLRFADDEPTDKTIKDRNRLLDEIKTMGKQDGLPRKVSDKSTDEKKQKRSRNVTDAQRNLLNDIRKGRQLRHTPLPDKSTKPNFSQTNEYDALLDTLANRLNTLSDEIKRVSGSLSESDLTDTDGDDWDDHWYPETIPEVSSEEDISEPSADIKSRDEVISAVLRDDINNLQRLLDEKPELLGMRVELTPETATKMHTLLMLAAKKDSVNCAVYLLNRGAEKNAFCENDDQSIVTAATLAAENGSINVTKTLIDWNADFSKGNVLLTALAQNETDVVNEVIQSEQWKPALRDYKPKQSPATSTFRYITPFREMMNSTPQNCKTVLDKLFLAEKNTAKIMIDTVVLEESFLDKPPIPRKSCMRKCIRQSTNYKDDNEILQQRRNIILHPVVQLYVHHKWRYYNNISIMNLLLFLLFLASFIGFIVTMVRIPATNPLKTSEGSCEHMEQIERNISEQYDMSVDKYLNKIFRYALWLSFYTQVALEVFELLIFISIVSRKVWRKCLYETNARRPNTIKNICVKIFVNFLEHFSFANLIEWPMLVLTLLILVKPCEPRIPVLIYWQRQCAAFLSIFIFFDLLLLLRKVRYFEGIGLQLRIIVQMGRTFLSIFSIFIISLVGFGFAFSIFFENQYVFRTIPRSIVKTLLMMIGEVDFGDLVEPPNNKYYNEFTVLLVFFLFVIIMTLMLINLFIGLITSDIEQIKADAKFEFCKMKVQFTIDAMSKIDYVQRLLSCIGFDDSILKDHLNKFNDEMVIHYDDVPTYLKLDFERLCKNDTESYMFPSVNRI